jgi:type IV pilus assembly protein PilA
MLARIRKAQEEHEGGFTLIELLVVIIIIGILAAIAIPVFLNQRAKATESGMKSDLRTIANQLETYFTDAQEYPAEVDVSQVGAGDPLDVDGTAVEVSDVETVVTYALTDNDQAYCVNATNIKVDNDWGYDSAGGGLVLGGC